MSREEMNETSVLQSIKEIFSNRPLFAIILSDFFNNFKAVGGSSEQYFWLNNTGAIMNQTICGLFTGIPNYLMVPMAAKLVKKLGARVTAILAVCSVAWPTLPCSLSVITPLARLSPTTEFSTSFGWSSV